MSRYFYIIFQYILIILIPIFISLYGFELYLNFQNNINFQNKNLHNEEKLKKYRELSKRSQNVSIMLQSYNLGEIKSLSGISNSLTIYCKEEKDFMIYTSDRFGFNNRNDSIWDENNYDAVFIGDSFVHGACVNYPYNIADNLVNNYSNKILNLGYSGSGPLLMFAIYMEYLKENKKSTDDIFWFYYEGNDMQTLNYNVENNSELLNYLKKDYSQKLISKDVIKNILLKKKLNEELNNYKIKKNNFSIVDILKLKNLNKFIYNIISSRNMDINNIFFEIIERIQVEQKKNGGNFTLVYLPDYFRYSQYFVNQKKYKSKNKFLNMLEDKKINYIDIDKYFRDSNDPLKYFPNRRYGHYNSEGYSVIAEHIYKNIK